MSRMKNRIRRLLFVLLALLLTGAGGCGKADLPEPAAQTAEESVAETAEPATESAVESAETEPFTTAAPETTQPESASAPAETTTEESMKDEFYILSISDEIFARIDGVSFKADCTLPREDLRYLHVLHKDLDGETHEGELIVNMHIAEDVLEIFRLLYEADYPIEKIRLVDEYGADDERSMADNNSSAFNFRFISYTTTVSKHGLGLAVDINPLYNPYTKMVNGERSVEPAGAEPYLDRSADFPYKIDEEDLCYRLFTERGFTWGGAWKNSKDYQHFEVPDEVVKEWYSEN